MNDSCLFGRIEATSLVALKRTRRARKPRPLDMSVQLWEMLKRTKAELRSDPPWRAGARMRPRFASRRRQQPLSAVRQQVLEDFANRRLSDGCIEATVEATAEAVNFTKKGAKAIESILTPLGGEKS